MNLGGLSALYGGYQSGQGTDMDNQLRQIKLQDAQLQMAGQQAFGRALATMFGGGDSAPPPPMPGQPSVPAQPGAPSPPSPAGAPGPAPMTASAPNSQFGQRFGAWGQAPNSSGMTAPGMAFPSTGMMPQGPGGPPPQGTPAMQPGSGMPAASLSGVMPPGGAQPMGGAPMSPQGGAGGVTPQSIMAAIVRANPGAPPQVLNSAFQQAMAQFGPRMDQQARFAEMEKIAQMRIEGMADRQADRLGGSQGQGGPITDDDLKVMVDRRLSGDKSVLQNIGRGAQGGAVVQRFNHLLSDEMRRRNMTGADLVKVDQRYGGESAYQRTAGTQGARVESASNEVEQLIPQAVETSRALPRGKFVPVNSLIQAWQQGTSDPAYNDFVMANFSLINAYTRAMNPQGVPRITERLEQKAIGLLSTATSAEAYETQVRRLWKEVQASKKAVAQTAEGRKAGDINAPVPGMESGGANDPLGIR